MSVRPSSRGMLISDLGLYLAFTAAVARAWFEVWDTAAFGLMVTLSVIYLLTLVLEQKLILRRLANLHAINTVQTAIALALLMTPDKLDYYSLLFIPPCTQSILNFPRKVALAWIGTIGALMIAGLLVQFPFSESIGYVIIYPTAIFLFSGFSYLAKQAKEAQLRSEALLADLQVANRKLHEYAVQVEELAATNERNRLARELHDSVTQIIFGITLSAQAARILLDRDPSRVAVQLDHMQALAQNALAEMRTLIQQLHPPQNVRASLAARLRKLADDRLAMDGLQVTLEIQGEQPLPPPVEDGLFRVVQEGLNNIAKHARTNHASLHLIIGENGFVSLCLEDAGIGFDPRNMQYLPGHLGLTSISERVQALGGRLMVESEPGKGTRLFVELSLKTEESDES